MNQQNQRLYNTSKMLDIFSISKATLYRWLAAGTFPKPIQINGRNYWNAIVIDQHISDLTGDES